MFLAILTPRLTVKRFVRNRCGCSWFAHRPAEPEPALLI